MDSIENLGTGGSPKDTGVGEVCVGGYCLSELITVEPGKVGLDMPSHGKLKCSCGKLHCVLQSLPDDVDGVIS